MRKGYRGSGCLEGRGTGRDRKDPRLLARRASKHPRQSFSLSFPSREGKPRKGDARALRRPVRAGTSPRARCPLRAGGSRLRRSAPLGQLLAAPQERAGDGGGCREPAHPRKRNGDRQGDPRAGGGAAGAPDDPGEASGIDPAAWQRSFAAALEAGLATWDAAEERLLVERVEWELQAGRDYSDGERAWAAAWEELDAPSARQWEAEIRQVLTEGEERGARSRGTGGRDQDRPPRSSSGRCRQGCFEIARRSRGWSTCSPRRPRWSPPRSLGRLLAGKDQGPASARRSVRGHRGSGARSVRRVIDRCGPRAGSLLAGRARHILRPRRCGTRDGWQVCLRSFSMTTAARGPSALESSRARIPTAHTWMSTRSSC